jgi:hypothetical protein
VRLGIQAPNDQWTAEAYITNLFDKDAVIFTNSGNYDHRQTTNEPRVCRRLLSVVSVPSMAVEATLHRRALNADNFFRMQDLSDPQVSPDGLWVAYAVNSNDCGANEARSAIWNCDHQRPSDQSCGAGAERRPAILLGLALAGHF